METKEENSSGAIGMLQPCINIQGTNEDANVYPCSNSNNNEPFKKMRNKMGELTYLWVFLS